MKTERINIRLTTEEREIIEKAAATLHLNMSSYIVSTIIRQANVDLNNYRQVILTEEEFKRFADALTNPPNPSKELIDLFKN